MQEITIDKELFEKEVLLKTAYSFTNRVYIHLSSEPEHWIVSWESKKGYDILPDDFENELIQQQVRLLIERKTTDTRKIIIARALASTIIDTKDTVISTEDNSDEVDADSILKGWYKNHDTI